MMLTYRKTSVSVLTAAALSSLISGATQAQPAFTNWSDVLKPGAAVSVGGVAQEFTYTSGPSGVTAVAPPTTNMFVAFSEALNASGDVVSMQIQNVNRTVSFVRANGDTVAPTFGGRMIYGLSSSWERKALVADPLVNGWKYQSFGAWVSGLGQASGSAGAASVGAITAGASVPQTGSASFFGLLSGIYNDYVGQDHLVAADMGLHVNFGAHSAEFRSTNTVDNFGVRHADLDITGDFLSLPNHPALFGQIKTQRLTGTTSAQFYGPNAEEVGGVFTLTPNSGQGLERFAAAFGAKRAVAPAKPTTTLTTWSQVLQPGAVIELAGTGVELTLEADGRASFDYRYEAYYTPLTFSETVGPGGAPTSLAFGSATRAARFSTAEGDAIAADPTRAPITAARSPDGARAAIIADPLKAGWDYQSFGVWENANAAGGRHLSAISYGSMSPISAIPTAGAATFTGVVGGIYTDEHGASAQITGKATAVVDFPDNKMIFSTRDMTAADGRSYEFLSLIGHLGFRNTFQGRATGSIATVAFNQTGDGLTGNATGAFYGPQAQEIGGTFRVTQDLSPDMSRFVGRTFIGGFGLKR